MIDAPPTPAAQSHISLNPCTVLIDDCDNDPARIRHRYAHHRDTRATQQDGLLLPPGVLSPGINVDEILARLVAARAPPASIPDNNALIESIDPRHSLTVWARPPQKVKQLVAWIQQQLKVAVPSLYLPNAGDLHITVTEVAHSHTPEEIRNLVDRVRPVLPDLADLLRDRAVEGRRAKLDAPRVTWDAGGIALSFLPRSDAGGGWGYHHLRRDVFDILGRVLEVNSRYVLPSAHITIARYIAPMGEGEMRALGRTLEVVNEALEAWSKGEERSEGTTVDGRPRERMSEELRVIERAEWTVGEEQGLEVRAGACWYGDGGWTVTKGGAIDAT
ncbi:RNA ligase/cyclic nucleotide phosphodiesterase [Mycena polygramma]|nr:RNA ligase/cyclic nucleotide phosphodiesterase [Mycena polygramma]